MSSKLIVRPPERPVIEIQDLHRIYSSGSNQVHAVRGISMTVQPGEFVAVMGASGSGKSTLMNTLGCLDRPTRGTCKIDGTDIATLDSDQLAALRNQRLGFVFQGFNLLTRTTALENVELPMLYARPPIHSGEMRKRAAASLERVGLGQRMDHVPSQLSGGQQQRVAIARALVLNPALLLADEPTGNLDTRTSIEIMGVFQALNDAGMTIVMVTHELDIASYTRRIVVMRDGRIVSDKPVTDRLLAQVELEKHKEAETAASLTQG